MATCKTIYSTLVTPDGINVDLHYDSDGRYRWYERAGDATAVSALNQEAAERLARDCWNLSPVRLVQRYAVATDAYQMVIAAESEDAAACHFDPRCSGMADLVRRTVAADGWIAIEEDGALIADAGRRAR